MRIPSSPRIRTLLVLPGLLAALALSAPAAAVAAETPVWSPQLAYVLTTGETRTALESRLALAPETAKRVRDIGWDLYWMQRKIQRRSDLIVNSANLSLDEKRELVASSGHNESLQSAEESAAARVLAATGLEPAELTAAVDAVWQEDAATHRLDTALTALGVTPAAAAGVGSFRVYGTRFEYDEGIAVPDKYIKFANRSEFKNVARPAGYPDGTYGVTITWDGIHRGIGNKGDTRVASAKTISNVKVLDVGPWNTDDNWWNSYTDPVRPRRINSSGISGNGGLAGKAHLAFGLPEAQAAYFNYYGRPSKIPAYDTSPMNYWDKPRGYGGEWSGADQFGRQVVNPAGIDLGHVPYAQLGMSDNEWVDVIPLWEARLGMNSTFKMTLGPYLTGQQVTFSFNVKNLGTMTGTWDKMSVRVLDDGKVVNPPDQGPFTLNAGISKTFSFTKTLDSAGAWSAKPMTRRAGVWSEFPETSTSFSVAQRTVSRISGNDRYETAVKVSQKGFPSGAPAVVIATGQDFPDALTGAALAHAEGAPLLLTTAQSLPGVVSAEIARLHPGKAIIIGSSKVVGTAVETQLASLVGGAGNVSRLSGWNRYETARKVAEAVAAKNGGHVADGTAIVATGRDFPDALAGSVLSAEESWPVLLTEPSMLPTDTQAAITGLGVTRTLVLGSDKVVSAGVLAALPSPTRIGGVDRYDTAARIADWADKAGSLDFAYVGLATGLAFPDALSGGTLAASNGGMLLLTKPSGLAEATRARLAAHRTVTSKMDAYGSTKVLPEAVLTQAKAALR